MEILIYLKTSLGFYQCVLNMDTYLLRFSVSFLRTILKVLFEILLYSSLSILLGCPMLEICCCSHIFYFNYSSFSFSMFKYLEGFNILKDSNLNCTRL